MEIIGPWVGFIELIFENSGDIGEIKLEYAY